jgi:hypothetical protein
MVKRGTAAYYLLHAEFNANFATYADVPEDPGRIYTTSKKPTKPASTKLKR